jgi:hypothetical protein
LFPENRHDLIRGERHAERRNAARERFAHANACAVEQLGKGIRKSVQGRRQSRL